MSNFMTIRIQVGVEDCSRFTKTILKDTTVKEMRNIIREHEKLEPLFGIVLIFNGKALKNPDHTLNDHGICNDSLIVCVISRNTGRDIELLIAEENEEVQFNDEMLETALECKFHERPFGFAVWANEMGDNAIVTKVSGKYALDVGVKIGYCIYKLNNKHVMYNRKHNDVLYNLKSVKCPVTISFLDLGKEYVITFHMKPLGFSVTHDEDKNNAKVSKIETGTAIALGVQIGSHVIGVNNYDVFGMEYHQIIACINKAGFPITLRFRQPPKLLLVGSRFIGKPELR